MNEVIKNTHAFVDVLCMARGEAVQNWDEGTFDRAYKWARYFEEVYNKLKLKPSLAEKLDKYISNFNKTGTFFLGNLELTFEGLQHSRQILRQFLLQNPHITSNQFQFVGKLYGTQIGYPPGGSESARELSMDLIKCNQLRGLSSVLATMRDKLSEDMNRAEANQTGINRDNTCNEHQQSSDQKTHHCQAKLCFGQEAVSAQNVGILSAAQLLFQYVHHHLTYSGKDERSLCDRLNILSEQENGLRIITACLVTIPDPNIKLHSQADQVQQFILRWILDFSSSEGNSATIFWNLPPTTLCELSSRYSSIYKLYLSYLVSWANHMMPVINCQSSANGKEETEGKLYQWRYCDSTDQSTVEHGGTESSDNSRGFQALLSHFRSLTSCSAHLCITFNECKKKNLIWIFS